MLISTLYPLRWLCSRCQRGLLSPLRLQLRAYSTSSEPNAIADLNRTRNIGIIAHIDAGKTTTTERMLYYSGFTRRIGDVDDGSTVTDFLPAERARGITIQSAAITFTWPPEDQSQLGSENVKTKGLPRSGLPHTINLIDTPGHADFTFEVLRSLRILDGAVCILDGVAGVEAQTEQVWRQACTYNIPCIAYVNKLDRVGAAFGRTVKEIGSRLGAWPAVCQIPWFEGGDGKFRGVGDVISLQGLYWEASGDGKQVKLTNLKDLEQRDSQFAQEMKNARVALVELLSEHDDTMVESFLEHNEDHLAVKPNEIWESLRRCLLGEGSTIVPTFAGASFRNIGVQPLLDAVVNLLPSPTERPDPEISVGSITGGLQSLLSGKFSMETSKKPSKHKHKMKHAPPGSEAISALQKLEGCALAFKVVSDARRGVLVYVRVYSGVLNRNALLFNTNLNVSERAPRILKMYANDAVEVQSIPTGHIGVIAGLKFARTGDTLLSFTGNKQHAPEPLNTLQLRPISVPPPVFFTSVESHSLSEEKNVQESLALLLREDPSLHVTVDEDSGQTLLSGMGELHLEIARDRLVKDFKAKASMGSIEIGYRECISGASSPVTRVFDKDIAGRKGKAGCTAMVQPLNGNEQTEDSEDPDILFSEVRDGNRITIKAPGLTSTPKAKPSEDLLPSHLSRATIQSSLYNGCLAALTRGPQHSFPIHSVDVTLTFDVNHHIFGSNTTPSALSAGARLATQSALKEVSSTSALMEPVMNVTISVQESSLGAVVHDISSSRGGHIVSLDDDAVSSAEATSDLLSIDISRIYAPPDPFGSSSSVDAGLSNASANQSRTITAKVPLKEMVGYLKHLRSLTGGRGTFVMSVDRFEKMSSQREKAALAAMRGL
ncbi:Ribosome-releasing factor 2, mitochondrial [Emydomyces testavorans]|uniref:Ribosome-releasing factor 2, mitochondrial n=1 Tax=Emydomyces testavorans TaxID=2070801 RepID=A0AAF0DF43_9EURO|nr:Ribosome-releasing factor 2, mitochondrial [Emydomyces testavorans]